MTTRSRIGKIAFGGIVALIGVYFIGALTWTWFQRDDLKPGQLVGDPPSPEALHPVTIRRSPHPAQIDSGRVDAQGKPILIACATCHDNRVAEKNIKSSAELDEFHQGLHYVHGDLTCLSCHNPDDYNTLRRADGEAVAFNTSMALCAQCHGPQHRDYLNGSHGGMTGHWDLNRGGRTRNDCIDCHDPHQPAYPKVTPVFPPKLERGESLPKKHHE